MKLLTEREVRKALGNKIRKSPPVPRKRSWIDRILRWMGW